MSDQQIKQAVKEAYTKVAEGSSCCGGDESCRSSSLLTHIGYSDEEISNLPEGAINSAAGCGNPTALASLKPGEVVLDLGSGAGIDVFLAAEAVGPEGYVIGVDMTEAMIEKARANAQAKQITNVEFRLGEIEDMPVDDASVDAIISNCVINLSPDKDAVFREAFRVLKPGGRMMVSDLVTRGELSQEVTENLDAWTGCIGGALDQEDYLGKIRDAGFNEASVAKSSAQIGEIPLFSISVEARKSPGGCC